MVVMLLGVAGAALFYGDSVITPAISVLSAVEGLEVPAPGLANVVLPVGVVILAALFAVQRYGTQVVGRLFGPIMVAWFVILALLGLRALVSDPAIVAALWPGYAVGFVVEHPGIAFVAMGAVVLAITGAEALYADMGHFGRTPIRAAWFVLVLPCLTLNYLGQGALILQSPSAVSSPVRQPSASSPSATPRPPSTSKTCWGGVSSGSITGDGSSTSPSRVKRSTPEHAASSTVPTGHPPSSTTTTVPCARLGRRLSASATASPVCRTSGVSQTGCRDLIQLTISATASGATSCGRTVSAPRRASVSAIRRPATAVMLAATIGTCDPDPSVVARSTSKREATDDLPGTRKTSS